MPNPQISQGGSGSVPRTADETRTIPTTWEIRNGSGILIADSASTNNWSVGASGSGVFPVTVGVPPGASAGTDYRVNYHVFNNTISYGLFDVIGASVTTFPQRLMSLSLLTDASSRQGLAYASRFAIVSVAPSVAVSRQGALTFQHRLASASVLTVTPRQPGMALPAQTVAISLLSTSLSRSAYAFPTKTAQASFLFPIVIRPGFPAGAGSHTAPYPTFLPPLLSAIGSAGNVAFAQRNATATLLSLQNGTLSGTLSRRIVSTPLLSVVATGALRPVARRGQGGDYNGPFEFMRRFLLALHILQGHKTVRLSDILAIMDILDSSYRTADLSFTSQRLAAVEPVIHGDGSTIYGTGNGPFILRMTAASVAMVDAALPDRINTAIYTPLMQQLNSYLSSIGSGAWTNLDGYLTAQNVTTPGSALIGPNAAYIQFLYNGKQGALLMSPGNVFAPQSTLATYAITGAGTGTLTQVSPIRTVNDTPSLLQGYTPSKGLKAIVTTAASAALTLTVTGDGRDAAGNAVSGRRWNGAADGAAGTIITLTPAIAGDRIANITAVFVTGGATSGNLRLDSVLERVTG